MKVHRLPVDPGPAAWNCILPAEPPYPEVEGTQHCDWLIIGAGFAGLAAARRLSQLRPNDTLIVVDAKRIAEGPSGRNSGFMIDLPHDLTSGDYRGRAQEDLDQIDLNRTGISFAHDAAIDYDMPGEAFDMSGKINAAASDKGMRQNAEYASHLKALNEPYSHLDQQDMARITGSNYYLGGLYTPGTAMIQPALFVRGMARGVSHYASVYENSPVTSLCRLNTAWEAKTQKSKLIAQNVILTVNGHLESFGFFKRRLLHVFTYASMTRALSSGQVRRLGGEPTWACTPADPMGTTVRRINGKGGARILVRNRFTYDPTMEIPNKKLIDVTQSHQKAFQNRFPALRSVEMQYRWAGRLCLSRNKVSAFGEIEPGLYSACCQNGLGVAKGTISGKLVSELACGLSSALLTKLLAQESPQKLPPKYISQPGTNAVIQWKEFRAGTEL